MNKTGSMRLLFLSRLSVYALAVAAPLYHPAVQVSYGRPGILLWFGIVPLSFVLAYLRIQSRGWSQLRLAAGIGLPLIAGVMARGLSQAALQFAAVGLVAFVLTFIVFHSRARGRGVAVMEPFLPALLYHRLISFSRASEDLAASSIGVTRLVLVVLIAGFLAHGLIIYLCFFQQHGSQYRTRLRKEVAVFLLVGVVVLGTIVTALPPDFVENPIVRNLLGGEADQESELIDEYGEGLENGASRDDESALRGIPSDRWPQPGRDGEGGTPRNQYAVMVVAAEASPSYLADRYYSLLEPDAGFARARDTELNELSQMRTLETWRSGRTATDKGRRRESIEVLSTLAERYIAYRPKSFEPTTLDRRFHPFSYSYRAVSEVQRTTRAIRSAVAEPDEALRTELAAYLEVPLSAADREVFADHLEQAVASDSGYHERIEDILRSFESFQYNAGYSNNVSVRHMVEFLDNTQEGDCVEFSHSTAILARMAGIPSRVVTGYLVAAELQTPSHRRGLELLIEDLPVLQEFDPDSLYLVTTAHRHAWVQLYLPEYGWVDFETTAYSIPPVGLGDPNQRDVIIPLLQDAQRTAPGPVIQPQVVLRFLAAVILFGLVGLLVCRYFLEMYLMLQARGSGDQAVRALFRLVLLRYASDGYPGKARSATALEYAAEHPELAQFAEIYTELRYRSSIHEDERQRRLKELRDAATTAMARARRPGPAAAVRRLLSLRGLAYQ
ncbi:MAG: transglutaminase family protein [Spirochaetia bacterium]